MESPTQERTAKWMVVTPELAEQWLKLNIRNRKSAKTTVRRYSSDAVDDRWTDTTDAIGFFASDGSLQNGQQRLEMIVQTGKAQFLLVTWGMSEESGEGQDRGRRRNVADLMYLAEMPASRELSSAYRYVLILRRIWTGAMRSFSDSRQQPLMSEIVEFAKLEKLTDAYAIIRAVRSPDVPVNGSLATALCHEMALATSYDQAEAFWSDLTNIMVTADDIGTMHLRRQLLRAAMSKKKDDLMDLAARIIKAWNLRQDGTTFIEQLSWRSEGPKAEAFPRIGHTPRSSVRARERKQERRQAS